MKKVIILLFVACGVIASCGLKYTPTETREDLSKNRKAKVSEYIRDSYKDTAVVYQNIVFGQTTLVKPYHHRLLDSLYEIKFANEQAGRFDKELEEKINNQKIVVATSNEKLQYIEHHVYNIQTSKNSNIYLADIHFNHLNEITDFKIVEQYEIPNDRVAIYKAFLTGESIVYPNYKATNEEMAFYNLFQQELDQRLTFEQNNFMNHMLNVFLLARELKSIETKLLLQNIAVMHLENRKYSSQIDQFTSVDGIWEGNELINYELIFQTPMGRYRATCSKFFEVIELKSF
ncbi:MAG TPA: hypothetical protein VKZ44_09410 [Taishania sp.]|nr:hypothetical protein [Taishania sp.]